MSHMCFFSMLPPTRRSIERWRARLPHVRDDWLFFITKWFLTPSSFEPIVYSCLVYRKTRSPVVMDIVGSWYEDVIGWWNLRLLNPHRWQILPLCQRIWKSVYHRQRQCSAAPYELVSIYLLTEHMWRYDLWNSMGIPHTIQPLPPAAALCRPRTWPTRCSR